MPVSLSEKVAIRRHLRYGIAGLSAVSPAGGALANGNIAYRFFQSYGQLESRMEQLSPAEESVLTGKAYGSVGFNTPNIPVQAGSVITVTINNSPQCPNQFAEPIVITYTVQASDTLLIICSQLAMQAALNVNFTSAGGYAVSDYGVGPVSQQIVPFPITSFICLKPFVITCTGEGNTIPQIVASGGLNPPTLWNDQTLPPCPIFGYLPICDYLENAFASASSNLSVSKAREATLRSTELAERQWLYDSWCLKLAQYLGVSLSPDNNGLFVQPRGVSGSPRRFVM